MLSHSHLCPAVLVLGTVEAQGRGRQDRPAPFALRPFLYLHLSSSIIYNHVASPVFDNEGETPLSLFIITRRRGDRVVLRLKPPPLARLHARPSNTILGRLRRVVLYQDEPARADASSARCRSGSRYPPLPTAKTDRVALLLQLHAC